MTRKLKILLQTIKESAIKVCSFPKKEEMNKGKITTQLAIISSKKSKYNTSQRTTNLIKIYQSKSD
jgi:hypothetical protein